jgi:KDO2-lipid IV(A) lauroyltransferase
MLVPIGPMKLAMMTGSPLVPIFAPRRIDGRVQIILEAPIDVTDRNGGIGEALIRVAAAIERTVRAFPEQWLVLQRAFCEDQGMTWPDQGASTIAPGS